MFAHAKPFGAGLGWLGLAGYVLSYDSWALATHHDTLSMVFDRGIKHPVRRWPVIAICVLTISHLFGWIPRKWDPFHNYANLLAHWH